MSSFLPHLLVLILLLVLVDAQYRMMVNYGPAWRQRMWRKTRNPSFDEAADSDLLNLLAN